MHVDVWMQPCCWYALLGTALGLWSLWDDQCDCEWLETEAGVQRCDFIFCVARCHAKKAAFRDRCLTATQLPVDYWQAPGSQEIYDILFIGSPLIYWESFSCLYEAAYSDYISVYWRISENLQCTVFFRINSRQIWMCCLLAVF